MPYRVRHAMRLLHLVAGAALLCLLGLPTLAQGDRTQSNDQDTDQRRSAYDFEDHHTSINNRMLANILNRFPKADTNEDGILDAEEGRAFIKERRDQSREQQNDRRTRGRSGPTHADVAYGPDRKHVLDLYLAESEQPTPLVVFFHGGQFITGDEDSVGTLDIRALLQAGISVASVDYRTTDDAPFPGPFEDAAQAVKFLRLSAKKYNLNPTRFAGHGEEAGGNLALYLALHDDLAETEKETADAEANDDAAADEDLLPWETPEFAAQSTRLVCVVARHPIASFDPRSWEKHKLPMNGHERLMRKYLDVRHITPLDDDEVIALIEDISPLALVSEGDPEVLLMSQYPDLEITENTVWTIMAHHPRQSQLIAQAMRAKGNRATVRYRGMRNDPGTTSVQFFIEKLK